MESELLRKDTVMAPNVKSVPAVKTIAMMKGVSNPAAILWTPVMKAPII
jgi:hypothetical protein